MRRRIYSAIAAIGIGAVLGTGIVVGEGSLSAEPQTASAAVGADFNPGKIISDEVFYDSSAMSAEQIQQFLNRMVPSCRSGYTCLKDYRQAYSAQTAKAEGCAAVKGEAVASAAWIISVVSSACGINPQAMIVLLQKEQGLITDTWPTAGQYRSATGYACPDTAACDAQYYGFFNQVYNAAWQFKKYRAYPDIRGYQAGRVNTILWHPNAGCGSSQVFIENQATAGLYIYTPYRPNQAALSNMYGTGDGCSSYGNRNFFRDFSDWFGSPTSEAAFARTADNPTIYLLAGGTKYPVPSMEVYTALSALGTYRTVTASYLNSFTTSSKWASETIRDPGSGAIYLAQGGSKHQFPSCESVAKYGFSCAGAIDLTSSQLTRWSNGAMITDFFVVAGSGLVYYFAQGGRYQIYEWGTVVRLNGGKQPFVATMRRDVAARYPVLKTILNPQSLAKSSTSDAVYFIDGLDRKIQITSFSVAGEYGARGYLTVPQTVLDGYPTVSGYLGILGKCSSGPVIASGGKLRPWSGQENSGLMPTELSPDTCSRLPKGDAGSGGLFVKTASDATVYQVVEGARKKMMSWEELLAANGGTSPKIVVLEAGTIASIPSAPSLEPASVVRTASNPMIYFIDGPSRKVPVSSFTTLAELGRTSWRTVSDASTAPYSDTGAYLTRAISCGGVSYFAAGGTLYPVAAASTTGVAETPLADSSCAQLRRASTAPLGQVFVKSPDSATVYLVTSGQRKPVASWTRLLELAGGSAPTILTTTTAGTVDLPLGGNA